MELVSEIAGWAIWATGCSLAVAAVSQVCLSVAAEAFRLMVDKDTSDMGGV
jgi:hypothetical protein